jgi:hypothetical protein
MSPTHFLTFVKINHEYGTVLLNLKWLATCCSMSPDRAHGANFKLFGRQTEIDGRPKVFFEMNKNFYWMIIDYPTNQIK